MIGLCSKRRVFISKQLDQRGCQPLRAVWTDSESEKIAGVAGEIIKTHCRWPNGNFLPDDPCDLLLTDSAGGLESVCTLMELSRRFGVENIDYSDVASGNFSQLVMKIKSAKSAGA